MTVRMNKKNNGTRGHTDCLSHDLELKLDLDEPACRLPWTKTIFKSYRQDIGLPRDPHQLQFVIVITESCLALLGTIEELTLCVQMISSASMPLRKLLKISTTVLLDTWQVSDLFVRRIYRQYDSSCLSQFLHCC